MTDQADAHNQAPAPNRRSMTPRKSTPRPQDLVAAAGELKALQRLSVRGQQLGLSGISEAHLEDDGKGKQREHGPAEQRSEG